MLLSHVSQSLFLFLSHPPSRMSLSHTLSHFSIHLSLLKSHFVSLSFCRSLSFFVAYSISVSGVLPLVHIPISSLSMSLPHTHTHSHSHTRTLTLSLSSPVSLPPSLSMVLSLSHSPPSPIFLSLLLFLTPKCGELPLLHLWLASTKLLGVISDESAFCRESTSGWQGQHRRA